MITPPEVRFEQRGLELLAVEIGQRSCSPLIGSVHRALFALGLDISSYRARPDRGGLVEHLVLERHGGGQIDGALSAEAKAAILPIAMSIYAVEVTEASRDAEGYADRDGRVTIPTPG